MCKFVKINMFKKHLPCPRIEPQTFRIASMYLTTELSYLCLIVGMRKYLNFIE